MSFFKMIEKIDLHNKDSYKPQDKVFVMNFGEGLDCFDEVNKTIYKPFRDWTVGCLDQLYTAIQPRLRHIKYVYKSVTMHQSL